MYLRNSVDSDEMQQDAASHLKRHCLPSQKIVFKDRYTMHFFFKFHPVTPSPLEYILEHPNFIVSNSMCDSINNKRFKAIALDVPFLKILLY